jgi:hypothetical protein
MADPADMSDQYNTPLTPEEQKGYLQWLAQLTQKQGRDVSGDVRDYDMQGAYKAGVQQGENGHFTDQFKKPSHPTFSTESQYSGKNGNVGGTWKDLGNGKWEYTPSKTNLKYYSPEGLQQYFRRADPNVTLAIPNGAVQ